LRKQSQCQCQSGVQRIFGDLRDVSFLIVNAVPKREDFTHRIDC